MRIQITGSRDFTSLDIVQDAITEQMIEPFKNGEDVTVIHGGAKGADTLANEAVRDYSWVDVEIHLANWEDCGNDCNPSHWRYRQNMEAYCPRAGYTRNQRMLDSGSDVCLAFFKTGAANKGTRMMAKLCAKAGIPVIEYWEEL